jgi:hypothetical protein
MNQPRPSVKAFLAYSAITMVFGYPLLLRLAKAVPNDLGDPLLNTWILWWNSRNLPLTSSWWNAPAFFPLPDALAFSEHLAGLSPLTSPLIWLSGSPQLAYTIAFLLTFVLSSMGTYVLALTVTKRHDVSFVAGLAYGFAPYRMAQLAHIQVLASFWMPLALAALHRYVDDRRPRWLVLFAVATAFQGLTNGYYLLFFPVLVGLWVLWFAPPGRRLATAGAIGGALAAAGSLLLPFLLHYRAVHEWLRLERLNAEVLKFSAGIDDLLNAHWSLALWGEWLGTWGSEHHLFPGLTAVALVGAAALWRERRSGSEEPVRGLLPRPVRLGLAVVAGVLSLIALARLVLGPWQLELPGLTISTGKLSKPIAQAVYAWLIVVLSGPSARRLVRSRSPFAFYSLSTVAMWVFSFGPAPTLGGVEVFYWGPYRWLMELPGFSGLRVPARFAMLATLCLSIAVALALARLQARLGRRAGVALVALAGLGILAEGWRRLPIADPPPPPVLSAEDGPGAVIELPFGIPARDGQAMYRGMEHLHPVVNGYSGHRPASGIVLRLALPRKEPELLRELAARGVRHVVVLYDRDRNGRWRRFVRSHPGARQVRQARGQFLFSLPPPSAPPAHGCEGQPLAVAGVESRLAPERLDRLFDGDPDTRWHTGRPQKRGDEMILDLGAVGEVDGVELALGPRYGDFPRGLAVAASLDKRKWKNLWRGPASARVLAAAIEAPRRMPVRVCFPPAPARYLRLRQIGQDRQFHWTVGELVVFGESSNGRPDPR